MIVSDQGSSYISSYVSFTETSMDIAEPEALGLPASIPRDQLTMSVITQEGYLDILVSVAGTDYCRCRIPESQYLNHCRFALWLW